MLNILININLFSRFYTINARIHNVTNFSETGLHVSLQMDKVHVVMEIFGILWDWILISTTLNIMAFVK